MKTTDYLSPFLAWSQSQGIITPLQLNVQTNIRPLAVLSNKSPPGFCGAFPVPLLSEETIRYMSLPPEPYSLGITSSSSSSSETSSTTTITSVVPPPASSSSSSSSSSVNHQQQHDNIDDDDVGTTTTTILQVPLTSCMMDTDRLGLAKQLEYEQQLGIKSKYSPWIQLFPTMNELQDLLPRFWSMERRKMVETYDGGQLERRLVVADDNLRSSKTIDPWAVACVDSRSIILPDTSTTTYALIPMLDMFNHNPTVSTSTYLRSTEAMSSALENETNEPPPTKQSSTTSLVDVTNPQSVLCLNVASESLLTPSKQRQRQQDKEEQVDKEKKTSFKTQDSIIESSKEQNNKASSWMGKLWGKVVTGGNDADLELKNTINNNNNNNMKESFSHDEYEDNEVCISYGNLNNLETLCKYGSVTSNNRYNTESIQIYRVGQPEPMTILFVDSNDDVKDSSPSRSAATASSLVGENDVSSQETLTILRISLATRDEFEEITSTTTSTSTRTILSRRNELEVLQLLKDDVSHSLQLAQQGIEKSKVIQDQLVMTYLVGRSRTLQKVLDRIHQTISILSKST